MSHPTAAPVRTVVHLVRHGEVHNPRGILYGRRDGFHLSERGRAMAEKVGAVLAERDVVHLRASPLERVQQTAAPLARERGLDVLTDERVIESTNVFEGERFGPGRNALRHPRTWRHLWNPWRPSWGEPYREVAGRMMAAVHDARRAAHGAEAVVVSHQLPIWTTRLHAERRPFLHDPRQRQCTLCSVTSLHFDDEHLVRLTYSEPAADLIPAADRGSPFSSGGSSPADAGSPGTVEEPTS